LIGINNPIEPVQASVDNAPVVGISLLNAIRKVWL
jgi:hypothetical protein